MQSTYKRYLQTVYDSCDPAFWKIFSTLHDVSSATVSKVLGETKKILKSHATGVQVGHRFPSSRRSLNNRIVSKAGMFWDNVTETHVIDLQQFNLPNVKNVEFTFINPIWVWIRRCEMLLEAGCELVFKPQVLEHPISGQATYGAGVQFGLLMKAAAQSIPAGGYVALMNLSWDGAQIAYGSRSSAPIQVSKRHICILKKHICVLKRHISVLKKHICVLKRHICFLTRHICFLKNTFEFSKDTFAF